MDRRRLEPMGVDLFSTTYPSGLQANVLVLPGFNKKYATLGTHYGSVDNAFRLGTGPVEDVPGGIAHFLEHKLFEDESGDVMGRFAELGAFCNAYTNYTSTVYLFSATTRFDEALALLVDFVQRGHFTKAGVDKEQGIIGQELRMYEDDPGWRVSHNLFDGLYQHHPIRVDIGGTVESISKITPELLSRCYRTFYHPSNLMFFAAGDVDPEKTFEIIGAHLAEAGPRPDIHVVRADEPFEAGQQRVVDRMPVSVPLFELGWKMDGGSRSLADDLAVSIMLETLIGHSSKLFMDLYERGLLTDRFGARHFAGEDFSLAVMSTDTKDPDGLLDGIMEGVARARSSGLDEEVFERVKRREIGDFIALFDHPEGTAYAFVETYHRGQDFSEVLDTLTNLSFEDVDGRLSALGEKNWTVSVVTQEA